MSRSKALSATYKFQSSDHYNISIMDWSSAGLALVNYSKKYLISQYFA